MAKKVNNILITGLSKEESEALVFAMNETGMATATGTIRKLLLYLQSTPPIHIEDYSIQEVPLKEKEKKFSITGFL